MGMIRDTFNGAYNGKTVLVTGHTGFKGSWLSIWLNELGANVIGYALDPLTSCDNFVLSKLSNKMVDVRGDVRDIEQLENTFRQYKPEFVFHLAAQPLVRNSYENPRETSEVNIMGTLNVLEAVRKNDSVCSVVVITTDKCYENKEQIYGYREIDPLGGYDPYSTSKACAELLVSSYRSSFMNPECYSTHHKVISSARAGNVIGGGDWSRDRIVPDCIKALVEGRTIEVRNPCSIRPWQHVLEALGGYLLLASKMYNRGTAYGGAWNFGPDFDSIAQVKDIVEVIINKWGSGNWVDVSGSKDLHEANLLSLDCTKAKRHLEWKPKLNIIKAVEYTVEWYKNYLCCDTYKLCRDQILEYIEG